MCPWDQTIRPVFCLDMFKQELRTYYAYLYSVINTSKNQHHNFLLIWLAKFLRNFVVHFYKPSIFYLSSSCYWKLRHLLANFPFMKKMGEGSVMTSQENIYIPIIHELFLGGKWKVARDRLNIQDGGSWGSAGGCQLSHGNGKVQVYSRCQVGIKNMWKGGKSMMKAWNFVLIYFLKSFLIWRSI